LGGQTEPKTFPHCAILKVGLWSPRDRKLARENNTTAGLWRMCIHSPFYFFRFSYSLQGAPLLAKYGDVRLMLLDTFPEIKATQRLTAWLTE